MLCCSWAIYFFAAASSENDHGSINFASNPRLVSRFKLSNDPQFAAKLKEIVGLYVDPPDHAIAGFLRCRPSSTTQRLSQPLQGKGFG